MKALLILAACIFSGISCLAQDIIVKKDGEEIRARIQGLSPNLILYKPYDTPEAATFSIMKNQVFMIKYASGLKEVVAEPVNGNSSSVPVEAPPRAEEAAPYQTKLGGPRFGVTYLTSGAITRRLEEEHDVTSNFISQFGWQFETRVFQIEEGLSGLVEFVPLIGGLDQGVFIPNGSLMFGFRGKSGLELGFGPNLSPAGTAVVLAAGTSFTSGNVHFPLNFAVVPSREGTRFSLMFGFNYRRK